MGVIYKATLLSPETPSKIKAWQQGYLAVSARGVIEDIGQLDLREKYPSYIFKDFSGSLITPSFVDLHNHLPQYAFAGLGDGELLTWLKKYAFPREAMFSDAAVARAAAEHFFNDLISNGTTTTVTYSTVHKSSTDMAFEAAHKSGLRAVIGKVVMTANAPKGLRESETNALNDTESLIGKWHGANDKLFYAITPRFAPSCGFGVMQSLARLAERYGVYVQTHLAENAAELAEVKRLFPKFKSYTDVYRKAGLLTPKTIAAHGIYLSDAELKIIEHTETKLAHCPTSNRFLKSGIMPFRKYQQRGLSLGLGTDVAGGYSLSMLNEMKEAIENSKLRSLFFSPEDSPPMSVAEAFYLATLGGAKALSLQHRTGSLAKGKDADFLIIDIEPALPLLMPLERLSKLIYRGDAGWIRHVFVQGKRLK
ncbi:MAG: guanine deaminase [Rhizobacter sp.]|nr:guanine deaminase [Chlorobiales bacterium]